MCRRHPQKLRLKPNHLADGVLEFSALDVSIEIETIWLRHGLVDESCGQHPMERELPNVLVIPKRTDEIEQVAPSD